MQRLVGLVRRCVEDYNMIQPGDRIGVGVSGGKDSLALLYFLAELKKYNHIPFELEAITIDMGLGMSFDGIESLCKSLDVPFTVVKTEIGPIVFDYRKEKNPCSMCSKMRRGALNQALLDRGLNKLALGHHYDDAVETFMMSLLYSRHKKVKNMIKDPNCKNKSYRINELDNIIFDEIKKLALDPSYIHEIKSHHHATDEIIQKTKIIQEKIADLETQISRFLDLYGKGRFTFEQLDKQIIPLEEQKNKLNEELKSLEEDDTESMSEDEAIEIIGTFEEALERGNFDEIRGIITSLINHIDIDNDDITIYWNFM